MFAQLLVALTLCLRSVATNLVLDNGGTWNLASRSQIIQLTFGCQADVVVRMFFHMFEKHLLHKQINVKRAGAMTLERINQLKKYFITIFPTFTKHQLSSQVVLGSTPSAFVSLPTPSWLLSFAFNFNA